MTTSNTRPRHRLADPKAGAPLRVRYVEPPAWTSAIPTSLIRQEGTSGFALVSVSRDLGAWLRSRGLSLSLLDLESLRHVRGLK
jgi:hypothetical protein